MSAFGRKNGPAGIKPGFGVARPMQGGAAPKDDAPRGGEQFPPLDIASLPGEAPFDPLAAPTSQLQRNADAMARLSDRANAEHVPDAGPQGFEASVHKIKEQVLPRLLERVDPEAAATLTKDELAEEFRPIIMEVLAELKLTLNRREQFALEKVLVDELLGLGPLEELLAWRSMWFMQFAAIIWTAALLQGPKRRLRDMGRIAKAALALGLAAAVWDVAGLRFVRPPYLPTFDGDLIADRPDDDDQRAVYEWATRHLPEQAVIQHNPALHRRIFNFGLYGTHRTGVADREARLYGARAADVTARIAMLTPIYSQSITPADMARRARSAGVDYLLFASGDPIWKRMGGPPPAVRCLYRQPLACLIQVRDIQP